MSEVEGKLKIICLGDSAVGKSKYVNLDFLLFCCIRSDSRASACRNVVMVDSDHKFVTNKMQL